MCWAPLSHVLVLAGPFPCSHPQKLWDSGYSALDIITTLFKVTRNATDMAEFMKLEFLKVILAAVLHNIGQACSSAHDCTQRHAGPGLLCD